MKKNKVRVLITAGIIIGVITVICLGFIYKNLNYDRRPMKSVYRAGFIEKTAVLPDGTVINYAEGGSGRPLLLIHGQGVSWEDYMEVLPELSENYRVYAVDCHGHGKSSHMPAKYSAEAMGRDFAWFIDNVIGEKTAVSGHSSGGLLAAWLAANYPEKVEAVILEDPPFFSSEPGNAERSFAWNDTFRPSHDFISQDSEKDFALYYLENCMWIEYFGGGKDGIVSFAQSYRERHDGPLKFFFLPQSMTRIFLFIDDYDPKFGNTFYDFSWFRNFDHAEILSGVECPALIIHNSWDINDEGILLGAMSGEQADRADRLVKDSKLVRLDSGHDSHAEKPDDFIGVLSDFLSE